MTGPLSASTEALVHEGVLKPSIVSSGGVSLQVSVPLLEQYLLEKTLYKIQGVSVLMRDPPEATGSRCRSIGICESSEDKSC